MRQSSSLTCSGSRREWSLYRGRASRSGRSAAAARRGLAPRGRAARGLAAARAVRRGKRHFAAFVHSQCGGHGQYAVAIRHAFVYLLAERSGKPARRFMLRSLECLRFDRLLIFLIARCLHHRCTRSQGVPRTPAARCSPASPTSTTSLTPSSEFFSRSPWRAGST